jgi:hypothetical protein
LRRFDVHGGAARMEDPVAVPTRNQWNKLKKTHGIPDGAVKGVNLGQELDKVDKAAKGNNSAAYAQCVQQYMTVANSYITKLDQKKVKNFGAFQKVFLDDYLGEPHTMLEGLKLQADGKKLYMTQLQKFFQAVQKLDANSKPEDIQRFAQFARGLSSVALRTKGAVDPKAINAQLTRIDAAKGKVGANATPQQVQQFITLSRDVANEVRKAAKAQALLGA